MILEDVKLLSEVWPEYTDIVGIEYKSACIECLDEYQNIIYT